LGISAGAGLVVIVMVTLGIFQAWIPFAAWLGAILTTAIVYFLARTGNGIAVERLILGGVAVSSLFGALQTNLLLLAEEGRIQTALNWIVGSLNGRGWSEVAMAGPYIAIALICACLLARYLNVLNLGDELAVGLGISLGRSRLLIGGTATLLAASAVSMAGLIGFVGLIVPHGMRLLLGENDYRWLIPLSAVGGALVLAIADLLSRLGAVELPVGAVTSLLGSPLFVWLLYRRSF
jgi:iron complex transport system permease protein